MPLFGRRQSSIKLTAGDIFADRFSKCHAFYNPSDGAIRYSKNTSVINFSFVSIEVRKYLRNCRYVASELRAHGALKIGHLQRSISRMRGPRTTVKCHITGVDRLIALSIQCRSAVQLIVYVSKCIKYVTTAC